MHGVGRLLRRRDWFYFPLRRRCFSARVVLVLKLVSEAFHGSPDAMRDLLPQLFALVVLLARPAPENNDQLFKSDSLQRRVTEESCE